MELRQIRYFVILAEELHFGRAAEKIPIAQSALSQQIKNLEEELDACLFHRDTHKVALTEVGEVFLKQAQKILAVIRETEEAVSQTVDGLNMGFVEAAFYEVLPNLLRSFKQKYPLVEIIPHQLNSQAQIDGLKHEELDVGIVGTKMLLPDVNYHLIREEAHYLAIPSWHPLAQQKEIRLKNLANENFVAIRRSAGAFYYDQFIQACMTNGFSPTIALTADRMQTLLAFVASGFGVALVHESARTIRNDLIYLPLKGNGPEPYKLFFAWRNQKQSNIAEKFIEEALLMYPAEE